MNTDDTRAFSLLKTPAYNGTYSSLLRIFNFFSKIIKLLVCGALDLTDGGGSLIFAVLIKSRSRSSREGTPGWAIEFPFCWEGLGALVRHGRLKMLLNCSYWSQDTFREQFKVSHVMVIVKLEPPGRGHWPMVSTWPLRPLTMWICPYCSDLKKLNAKMCLIASETIIMTIIQTEDTCNVNKMWFWGQLYYFGSISIEMHCIAGC